MEHRAELRRAGSELVEALQDWRKFVEVLSSVGDKLNFAPSELGMISRVNRLLLDSVVKKGVAHWPSHLFFDKQEQGTFVWSRREVCSAHFHCDLEGDLRCASLHDPASGRCDSGRACAGPPSGQDDC